MNNKNNISVQLPEEVYTELKNQADLEFMSLSAYVRKLLILNYKETINAESGIKK